MSGDNFVESDKDESLAEHGEVDVVDPVELETDDDQEDDLGQKCDQVQTSVIVLDCQIQKIEVNTEIFIC